MLASATTNDQIVYTFDQAIAAANKLDYGFYLSNGTEQDCGVVNCTGAVVNPSNFDQVVVTVQPAAGAGPNATLGATGGIAYANAATAANGAPALLNADDEVGGANPNIPASTIMPGTVNGPQLQSVHVASTSTALGTTTTATYTFSEAVKNPIAAVGGLHLYDPDGTELTCNALAVPSAATVPAAPNNNQVICTSFVQNAAGGAATTTQLTAAALGTVDYNTVVGNATGTTGASNPGQNNVNPEGGVATS